MTVPTSPTRTSSRIQVCEGGRQMLVTEYEVDFARVRFDGRGRASHPDAPGDAVFRSAVVREGRHAATFAVVEALPVRTALNNLDHRKWELILEKTALVDQVAGSTP